MGLNVFKIIKITDSNNLYQLSGGSITNFTISKTDINYPIGAIWISTTTLNPLTWNYNLTFTSPAINKGININITRDFNNIYDWIITKAASTCPDDCWRIQEPPYFWTSDTLMARYMLDYKEHKHAESEKILNAHSYYRIMRIFHQYGNVKDI
jgi:hypothetical protein